MEMRSSALHHILRLTRTATFVFDLIHGAEKFIVRNVVEQKLENPAHVKSRLARSLA